MQWRTPVRAALAAAFCLAGCSSMDGDRRGQPLAKGLAVTGMAAAEVMIARRVDPRRATPDRDVDGDGIDDDRELSIAKSYFPYYSLHPRDDCSRHGVLFRVAPHPADHTKLAIWYVVLFERDCGLRGSGLGGHVGDDEVFGALVDPNVPAPGGILALRAVSHQNTHCERTTTCGRLPGCTPCATAPKNGEPYPIVFSSLSKHGTYTSEHTCNAWSCDLMACTVSPTPDEPEFTNAGEPGHPLTNDLTTDAFVNGSKGWTAPELMHFDPWDNGKFGAAGDVTDDLTDSSFLVSPSGC